MLLRTTDPFRDLDRLTQQLMGTTNRPAVMPMDAWREGDRFVIEFDLPGVSADSIDLDVERNVLTVLGVPSAVSWCSATTSTSSASRRATPTASCASSYRSRRRPSRARSRSREPAGPASTPS